MIDLGGTPPEDLAIGQHIKDVKKGIKGASKTLKALDKKNPSKGK